MVRPATDFRRQREPSEGWQAALRDEIIGEIRDELAELRKMVMAASAQVAPVHVEAPNVSVAAPNVQVAEREQEAPEVSVNMDLSRLEEKMDRVTSLLAAPVTRTVTRDAQGLIVSVTERRG